MEVTIDMTDQRTGRRYIAKAYHFYEEMARESMKRQMERDYIKSLPLDERIKKKQRSTDFNCPFCLVQTNTTIRKVAMTSVGLFSGGSYLKDVFLCEQCGNEHSAEELSSKKEMVSFENTMIAEYETRLEKIGVQTQKPPCKTAM